MIVRLMENYKRTEDMAAVAGMTGLVAPDTSRETFLSVMASLRAQMAQVKAVYEEQEQLVDELLRIVCGSG